MSHLQASPASSAQRPIVPAPMPSIGREPSAAPVMERTVDPRGLRRALGASPTGVAVVTTRDGQGDPIGLTISSFNSVSMDPPLILWSIGLSNGSLSAFRGSRSFAVNVLAQDQRSEAMVFSRPVADRFADVSWRSGYNDVPVIDGAAAVFECDLFNRHHGGDHEIILGHVVRHGTSERSPLVFGRGEFRALGEPLAADS